MCVQYFNDYTSAFIPIKGIRKFKESWDGCNLCNLDGPELARKHKGALEEAKLHITTSTLPYAELGGDVNVDNLVLAKLDAFPYWPAYARDIRGDEVLCEFISDGQEELNWVPVERVQLYTAQRANEWKVEDIENNVFKEAYESAHAEAKRILAAEKTTIISII